MLVCERDLQAYSKVFLVGKISISLLWLLSLLVFFLILLLVFCFLTMFYCSSFRTIFNWVRTVIYDCFGCNLLRPEIEKSCLFLTNQMQS